MVFGGLTFVCSPVSIAISPISGRLVARVLRIRAATSPAGAGPCRGCKPPAVLGWGSPVGAAVSSLTPRGEALVKCGEEIGEPGRHSRRSRRSLFIAFNGSDSHMHFPTLDHRNSSGERVEGRTHL
ncbi:hypothetical protein NDU88_010515 [Pleurodeles waltl]|uniref:Secreted protein n=1 Tax=Pleurodeles waltl TaxID=8319 RepID=A0AAV7S469_PLEWA|nr:hypothetical protein NDU88_010515 [Pleurodeles waltl]